VRVRASTDRRSGDSSSSSHDDESDDFATDDFLGEFYESVEPDALYSSSGDDEQKNKRLEEKQEQDEGQKMPSPDESMRSAVDEETAKQAAQQLRHDMYTWNVYLADEEMQFSSSSVDEKVDDADVVGEVEVVTEKGATVKPSRQDISKESHTGSTSSGILSRTHPCTYVQHLAAEE
jgi:hypothetical protein